MQIQIGVELRAPWNYDVMAASNAAGLACTPEEDKAQQQFADECDINTIVRRFGLTGQLPDDLRMPVNGDFTGVCSFEEGMLLIRQAEEQFMTVPAEIRARFNNDPGRMIAFLEEEGNRDEAMKLGLLKPPAEVTRVEAVAESK